MTTKEYQMSLAQKMINQFKRDFEQKTAMKVEIRISDFGLNPENGEYIVSLQTLEEVFLKSLPYEVSEKVLRSKKRDRDLVDIRAMFAFIALSFSFTLQSVATHMHKHHTTILHLRRKVLDLLETDPQFSRMYSEVKEKINNVYATERAV